MRKLLDFSQLLCQKPYNSHSNRTICGVYQPWSIHHPQHQPGSPQKNRGVVTVVEKGCQPAAAAVALETSQKVSYLPPLELLCMQGSPLKTTFRCSISGPSHDDTPEKKRVERFGSWLLPAKMGFGISNQLRWYAKELHFFSVVVALFPKKIVLAPHTEVTTLGWGVVGMCAPQTTILCTLPTGATSGCLRAGQDRVVCYAIRSRERN